MLSWIRWVLVVTSSMIILAGTLFLGMVTHFYTEKALFPPDDFISGYCMNEAVIMRLGQIVIAFAGLSAVTFVVAAVGMAPRRKVVVAWSAFALGALGASVFRGSAEFYSALLRSNNMRCGHALLSPLSASNTSVEARLRRWDAVPAEPARHLSPSCYAAIGTALECKPDTPLVR